MDYAQYNATESKFKQITLKTDHAAEVHCRYYQSKGLTRAVIYVGGIGGDFDTPARQLYPRLADRLMGEGISGLRVAFRYPTDLAESVQDVLAGIKFLQGEGAEKLGLVGHSFGGAVVIQAGSASEAVKTVVTLATQSFGTESVPDLSTHASILLIHGEEDQTLSPGASEFVYSLAGEPKKLELLEGNGHSLDESAEQVFQTVHDWLIKELK